MVMETTKKFLRHSTSRRAEKLISSDCKGTSCVYKDIYSTTTPTTLLTTTEMSKEEWLRELERREFYKNYNSMDGAITAVVLGGFFAFVCLLVIYKTKCKPMWKNRRKRLTNTPATQSNAEVDICGQNGDLRPNDEEYDEEEEEEEDDDEDPERKRNPPSPPLLSVPDDNIDYECIPLRTACLSEDFEEDLFYLDDCGNYVFPLSTPGSCSCPPSDPQPSSLVETNYEPRRNSQVSSVSNAYTVKSLPGAYLYIPVVDPKSLSLSSVKRSLSDPEIHFAAHTLGHPVILTVNPSSEISAKRGSLGANTTSSYHRPVQYGEKMRFKYRSFSTQVEPTNINIHVIQPTPTISPAPSMRSFNGSSAPLESVEENSGEDTPAPSTVRKKKKNVNGRVVFSENSEINNRIQRSNSRRSSTGFQEQTSSGLRQRRLRNNRQLTLPASSHTFLTVPGGGGGKSPKSDKRSNSFCSIVSEDDGDLFDSDGQLKEDAGFTGDSVSKPEREKHSISEMSEICGDELQSDISEIFLAHGPSVARSDEFNDGVAIVSEEEVAIGSEEERSSLNIFSNYKKIDKNESSSCSESIGSETSSLHQITVPVTIEHPPPELRISPAIRELEDGHIQGGLNYIPQNVEEILPANIEDEMGVSVEEVQKEDSVGEEEEGDFQMVLVRDIGIQVSGDSPNLSLARSTPIIKSPSISSSSSSSTGSNQHHQAYVERFPPEILF